VLRAPTQGNEYTGAAQSDGYTGAASACAGMRFFARLYPQLLSAVAARRRRPVDWLPLPSPRAVALPQTLSQCGKRVFEARVQGRTRVQARVCATAGSR
jgi:hypothetical protein